MNWMKLNPGPFLRDPIPADRMLKDMEYVLVRELKLYRDDTRPNCRRFRRGFILIWVRAMRERRDLGKGGDPF